jgi:hypothetical protein
MPVRANAGRRSFFALPARRTKAIPPSEFVPLQKDLRKPLPRIKKVEQAYFPFASIRVH